MIYMNFVESIKGELAQRIRSYAGAMLVDVVYNYQGSEIVVVWSNYNTAQSEIYRFPIISGDQYTESVNDGADFSSYMTDFINDVYRSMLQVESVQSGRPAAF